MTTKPIDFGPCPHCATGRLTQFPGSIDAVCAPVDHRTQCTRCRRAISHCVNAPAPMGSDRCPWPPPWSCGYWAVAETLEGAPA